MNNKKIGFWKWLYTKARDGIKDEVNQSIASTIGGIIIAVVSLAIGTTVISLGFIGVPVGILLFLYGIYKA
jgi:hypothetical protein